ncbi:MAG TPA: L-threonylcarbamoyladenylate synthase [Planctomycetota bacterium]|nr:L-threonylcarbamoyladenylate synthase [Planctomycetota bacterium]
MRTEYLTLDGGSGDAAKVAHAATLLQAGALVAFPTETVYGLGADSRNPEALARLAKVKGRDEGKPYSLLVPSLKQAESVSGGFSRIAAKLARLYWPGPLTLVVPRRSGGSIGLRLPEHPVARMLLSYTNFPLATPSASRNRVEPVTARQVKEQLDGEISLILDGGPARHGRPSTIVKVDSESIEIKREGMISQSEVTQAARPTILFVCTGNTCRSPMAAGFCQLGLSEATKGDALPFRVLSAGTSANDGDHADRLAIEAMREVGVDISRHRTRGLTPQLVDTADWIFTMTRAHRESIVMLMPAASDRVQLLSARNEDIPDPVSTSPELYKRVRDRIASCLRDVVRLVGGT